MSAGSPIPSVSGYVLAGGRSTRMGRDKALLELGGRPLVAWVVEKLHRITADVHILGNRLELEQFAPVLADLHEGSGPLGGMETALHNLRRQWALVMPVDMPFVPVALLDSWISDVVERSMSRVAMFSVDERPQAALCLLHREVGPYIADAVAEGHLRLDGALEDAARTLAVKFGVPIEEVLLLTEWNEETRGAFLSAPESVRLSRAERAAAHRWFANLNTPQELAEAEKHADALVV